MEKLELLAPAQNYECAISAINCGADAIYIGANQFGARVNAGNNTDIIEKIVKYAHIFNVKVYVTINTILDSDEINKVKELIQNLYEINVDAIIFQDFGILDLALNQELPPIVLHASTQCDIRDLDKVKFFENIGLKRVILARELSIEEIKKIRKSTNIELEHFVAGALCVSYSGQCYMSDYIGKRSANRGNCAQACRKKYSLIDKNGKFLAKNQYLLSLKDNNLSQHINKLAQAGVTSFKIEGRLKDENYVKNNVLYYHNILKKYPRTSIGEVVSDFEPDIEKTFNRGFCDDYLFSKKDNIYNFITPKSIGEKIGTISSISDKSFIIKTTKEISPQDGLCFIKNNELIGCLVNKSEKVKEGIKIYPNKQIRVEKNEAVYRNLNVQFNKILSNSRTVRKLDIDIVVKQNEIILYDINKNKVNIILEQAELAQNIEKAKENYKKSLSKTNDTPFRVKNITFETDELFFIPVSKLNEIRRKLLEDLANKILSRYKTKKQKQIDIAQFPKNEGDYRLNVHNSKAKEFYELCNCKVCESSFESNENHSDRELMRSKHCLKRAFIGCGKNIDNNQLFLVDEKGMKFPLEFDCKNCEMIIKSP